MSLITQCPVCGTMFKVVRDQLKISEGWVRCGQCTEVFDSSLKLRELDLKSIGRSETFDQVAPEELARSSDETIAVPESVLYPVGGRLEVVAESGRDSQASDLFLERVVPVGTVQTPNADLMVSSATDGVDFEGDNNRPVLSGPSDRNDQPDFSFISNSQRASVWYTQVLHAGLVCMVFVLLLLLWGQLVFHERDRLAATDPRIGAFLKTVCEQFQCAVSPLRRIESIAVDASSFNKLHEDTYELSFVITNKADTELARPALEVTLTDSQDRPLLRRVLLPSELDSPSGALSARGEWLGRYAVSLAANAGNLAKSIAGYRIVAFYP